MKLSDAEWTVMRAVWEAGSGPTAAETSARELLERIELAPGAGREPGWAYTTLKTMLARLVEKGALRERKRGNVSLYEPLVTQEQARRSALHSLVDRAFDGAFGPLLQHIVTRERLSTRDRETLQRMIAELDEPAGETSLDGEGAPAKGRRTRR